MLVIVGANGRTGVEIVKEALARGMEVRPVCRNDQDSSDLEGIVPVEQIHHADPDAPESLGAAMVDARHVVVAIDPRVAGPGAPLYRDLASGACMTAAFEAGAEAALYLSVAGGYRWSKSPLNRRAFHLDRSVTRSRVRWSMMRFASFHDEVVDGHVSPPDGRRPHPLPTASRYSPLSRRDAAGIVLDTLPHLTAGRTIYVGGPQMLYSHELEAIIAPYRVQVSGPRTRHFPLPQGDLSVLPDATRVAVGSVPPTTLAMMLQPPAPAFATPLPVPQRSAPGPTPRTGRMER